MWCSSDARYPRAGRCDVRGDGRAAGGLRPVRRPVDLRAFARPQHQSGVGRRARRLCGMPADSRWPCRRASRQGGDVIDPEQLAREFEVEVGRSPRIYRAPGRVNLIAEHTDYNDGFVMPVALDRSTWVAAAPRADGKIVVRSRDYGETATIDFDGAGADPPARPAWARYVFGVVATLDARRGADLM